jgi:DNA-binding CsgD family transcriptional regulator
VVDPVAALDRGRETYASQAWGESCEQLEAADRSSPLGARDLERLATCLYMLGREAEYLDALERAYHAHLDEGDELAAVRAAFWIGVNLARAGRTGPASGWLGRAGRLLGRRAEDSAERGYLLLPTIFEREANGDLDGAADAADEAAAIGERFGDGDLFGLAAHERGHLMIRRGRIREGVKLLDEAMVAVSAGELSPIVSGIVYCGSILACREAHEVRRAKEWTAALSAWCESQPDLVAFTGRCLVHRAELMQLDGAWQEALEEAERARERCLEGENPGAAGEACYRRGEVHRMMGEHALAERAYREASSHGCQPQPGLALLRLAEGNTDAAEAAIRRVATEASEVAARADLLPAYIEIMLAAENLEEARRACDELESIAAGSEAEALTSQAAHARGAVELAREDPAAALGPLRGAIDAWRGLHAPYEVARTRELIGRACWALGDEDTATLELDAARAAYRDLRASTDLARLEGLSGGADGKVHGLTSRELEVLRHVVAGETNKAIAAELVVSERTIDRHVSNIFAKLGVSSRAAATAYAYQHGIL